MVGYQLMYRDCEKWVGCVEGSESGLCVVECYKKNIRVNVTCRTKKVIVHHGWIWCVPRCRSFHLRKRKWKEYRIDSVYSKKNQFITEPAPKIRPIEVWYQFAQHSSYSAMLNIAESEKILSHSGIRGIVQWFLFWIQAR